MRSWANQSLSLLLWEGSTYFPYLVEGSHGLVNFLCAGSCARCFNAGRSQLARGEGHVYRWFTALWGIVLSRPLSGLLRGGRVKRSLGRVCMCWKCSLLRDGDILTCEPLWLPRCSYSPLSTTKFIFWSGKPMSQSQYSHYYRWPWRHSA